MDKLKLKDIIYKISDINEICIQVLEKVNCTDTNCLLTILRDNRHHINRLYDMVESKNE